MIKSKSERFWEIDSLSPGQEAVVVGVRVGVELQGRLMGLGLFVGSKVKIVQGGNSQRKPLILAVGNTRFAIERDLARTILVEPT